MLYPKYISLKPKLNFGGSKSLPRVVPQSGIIPWMTNSSKWSLFKKAVACALIAQLLISSLAPYKISLALAQENLGTESGGEGVADTESVQSLTPIPEPPPLTSDAYDAWKEAKKKAEAEQEALEDAEEALQDAARAAKNERDNLWEVHEEDTVWVASHGGSEDSFVSGAWEEEQRRQEELAAQESSAISGLNTCEGGPGPVAVSSEGSVDGTATSTEETVVSVANDNCLIIGNDINVSITSGENSQIGNDGNQTAASGDVFGEGRLVNQGNVNVTDVDDVSDASASAQNSFAEGGEAENLGTDEDSTNLAASSETDTLTVNNSNYVVSENNMEVDGVSGANLADANDGGYTLTSGDVELIANMLNILNVNITGEDFLHLIVNIFGSLTGDIDLEAVASYLGLASDEDLEVIARNETTGEDSENTATADVTKSTEVKNENTAEVENNIDVSGVSGQNTATDNDGDVDILTGRIKVLANLMNFINANFTGERWKFIMINVFGGLTGNIILPGTEGYLSGTGALASNQNLGEDSENTATSTVSSNTEVINSNDVTITNSVGTTGVSGGNSQTGNDGPATTATGLVDVASQIVNFLNFNLTGDNWVLLIVNVFGHWLGQIVNFAGGDPFAPPEKGTLVALSVGEGGTNDVSAINTGTGEGSENTAEASLTQTTEVKNNNIAQVSNNIDVSGVSGENAAGVNDGKTKVVTGWVELNANLLNIVNFNVTGRNWFVVFLNVFGDFAGNLFFGPPPPLPSVFASSFPGSKQEGGSQSQLAGEAPSNTGILNGNLREPTQIAGVLKEGGSGGRKVSSLRKIKKTKKLPVILRFKGNVSEHSKNGASFGGFLGYFTTKIVSDDFMAFLLRLLPGWEGKFRNIGLLR